MKNLYHWKASAVRTGASDTFRVRHSDEDDGFGFGGVTDGGPGNGVGV